MSNRYREALTHLTYGVQEGGGFVLLTGEVGTGKTTVCRCLLQQLPENTRLAFVLNPKLNSVELLATICDELKIDYPQDCQSLKVLTDKLSEFLLSSYQQNLNVVVMIDEAQNLATEVLEQVRLLTNLETNQKKLLQIILVGQPELQEKLAKRELRQLAQRVTARYHLRPLDLKESIAYVLHRVRIAGCHRALFSRSSIEYLHTKTEGIPRLINTICDRALLGAANRHKDRVDKPIMVQAVKEILGDYAAAKTNHERNFSWLKPFVAAFAILGIAGFSYWAGKSTTEQTQAAPLPGELKAVSKSDNASQSSAESLVEQLIGDQRWDSNGNWSLQSLLKLWQVEYFPLRDGNGCDFAEGYRLKCSDFSGNWQQLRELNRPAILKFSAGLQGEFWGTLQSLNGTEATIIIGDKHTRVKLQQLSSIWSGDYRLLWWQPSGFSGDIKFGDQGEGVQWLAQNLAHINQQTRPTKSLFDEALKQELISFQRQRNLNADGIAGMQTILKINAETLSGIPLLATLK